MTRAWPDDGEGDEGRESNDSALDDFATPAPGETVGRYVLLHRLASGAMGVVHAAYDPELDRKIALKLLHVHGGQRLRDALVAEAQALAKLAHPNVVAVHDVGTHDGRIFIAMEYVPGRNLRKAMLGGRLPWQEALRLLVPAGHGLVAAHAAGMVHRDFKPENVLLGDDGRICVGDFGIARPTKRWQVRTADGAMPRTSTDTTDMTVAPTGTVAYMPPEQFVQDDVDVRSDQFAFCVVLFEAITGKLPFAATSAARRQELLDRRPPQWPPHAHAPRWLRRVVERGLAFNPDARYPSMTALLDALRRGTLDRRLGWTRAAAASSTAIVAGLATLSWGPQESSLCTDMERHLEGVWDEPAKLRFRERTRAIDPGVGFVHVEAMLDDYASAWVAERTRTCEATRLTGEQSEARLDRHMACLDARLQHFVALLDLLHEADDHRALAAVGSLPTVISCSGDGDLALLAPPNDPTVRARVEALRAVVAHVNASLDLAVVPPSLEVFDDIVDEARAIGHPLLLADALLTSARIARDVGRLDLAEGFATEALAVGARVKHDHLIARGWLSMLTTLTHAPHRIDEFERVGQAAELATVRDGDPRTRLELLTELGIGLGRQGRFEEARLRFEEALDLVPKARPGSPLALARAANNLGATLERLGDYDAAAIEHARAIAWFEELLGTDHPELASPLTNLGAVHAALFDHEVAVELHERAIDIVEAARGMEHPSLVPPLVNAGFALIELHRHEEAHRQLMRALNIAEASLGASHPVVAYALVGLGRILVELDRHAEALSHLERAHEVLPSDTSDHNLRGELRFSLARAVAATGGDLERAHELCRSASVDFTTSETAADRLEAVKRWLAKH